jgi:glycosyltransferase involved in cell wall biosynthesis
MRILYFYMYFVARQGHGMTRAYEFARRLIDAGHDVTMITSAGYLPDEYKRYTRPTHIAIEGVPTLIIPVPYSNYMRFPQRIRAFVLFAARAAYHGMKTRADVVYASSAPLTIAIPGILSSRWQRIPMVFEVRDLWPELPIAIGALKNPILKWAARALEWIAYHAARHIVALSPGIAEGVARRGIRHDKITVIPNAADLDLFDVPPESGDPIRARLGIRADQPLIVYTGTFGIMNNVGFMVQIAAQMRAIDPDVRFLLIGSGGEYEKVEALAHELGVSGVNLHIWRPVSKNEIPAVLSAATVATSLFAPVREMWNNSANKFFDALAAGRPIVINYGGWQADLIHETGAGLRISDSDPLSAARDLAAFARDSDRLEHARIAARELARTRFDREHMAARLERLLREITS